MVTQPDTNMFPSYKHISSDFHQNVEAHYCSNRQPVRALKSTCVFNKCSRSVKGRPWSHQPAVQPLNDPAALLGTASPDGTCSCVGSSFPLFLVINVFIFCLYEDAERVFENFLYTALLLHISASSQYFFFSTKNFRRRNQRLFFFLIKSHIIGEKDSLTWV